MTITEIVESQKSLFRSGSTRSVETRKRTLQILKQVIKKNEKELCDAIRQDFGKPYIESFITEIYTVLHEIDLHLKNLDSWSGTESVVGSMVNFPSKSVIYKQPRGTVLIIGAWNYPVYLTFMPLVGALSAGNTVVLKPSDMSPITTSVIGEIIASAFRPEYITVVVGAAEETQELLKQPFDYIFFTGSTRVGKIVMKAAAENLVPVTLELGGKSPAIVHEDADIGVAAKRIWWGKSMNAGQTCVAPDYVLIHESLKEAFIRESKSVLANFFEHGFRPGETYTRIINNNHFDRLVRLLHGEKIVHGGKYNREERIIEPAILEADWESEVMQEEIFGPLLPLITYRELPDVIQELNDRPIPLALYLFTGDAEVQETIIAQVPFGGGCINDTISHLANQQLPFGGAGYSGMGSYHGKYSFETFSRDQAVLKKPVWPDPELRYPPYDDTKLNWFKKLFT
ncbi:MAG TPA: aldehyde dehydrogenase [Balneolaceae bacterium]|nr:aldehyde dehydrogenase [Balneolaceae bacterium]